ncbi:MAG: tyrosine-type recombinase/integrase [Fimbriimonadaceae bacterium]|nr:tyrosine-type recombinase/integrase [Fimbriimonadaceae bacterium]
MLPRRVWQSTLSQDGAITSSRPRTASPVSPDNLTRDFRQWAKKNGLEGMRLHDLRGSYVFPLIESGADIRTVQELARHSDSRTTMEAYARPRQPVKEQAIEGLRRHWG